ncbi:unnamed protein product [Somion occarium]
MKESGKPYRVETDQWLYFKEVVSAPNPVGYNRPPVRCERGQRVRLMEVISVGRNKQFALKAADARYNVEFTQDFVIPTRVYGVASHRKLEVIGNTLPKQKKLPPGTQAKLVEPIEILHGGIRHPIPVGTIIEVAGRAVRESAEGTGQPFPVDAMDAAYEFKYIIHISTPFMVTIADLRHNQLSKTPV